MNKIFAVVGEDARQQAAADYLRGRGYTVLGADEVYRADFILLPMPLDAGKAGLARLLRAAKPGALALGGMVSPEAEAAAEAAKVGLLDYYGREELAQLNAIPTAEGCIGLLLQHRRRTLWGSGVLVAGYGRIGRALAQRLTALGAAVTVAARDGGQRAAAEAEGASVIRLEQLAGAAPGFDALVNTVPAPVITARVLGALGQKAGGQAGPGRPPAEQTACPQTPGDRADAPLVIDLASRPGGTDFEAARVLGVRAIHALSLPARCAPATAGGFVGQTVLAILQERGELYDNE